MKTWQQAPAASVAAKSRLSGVLKVVLILTGLLFVGTAVAYAQLPEPKVHEFPFMGNRGAVWIVAQLHILFAAFILGAPIFVVVREIRGWKDREHRCERVATEVTSD